MAVETEEVLSSNWAVQYQGGRAHAQEIISWMEECGGNGRYIEPQEEDNTPGQQQSATPEYLIVYQGTQSVLARKGDYVVLDAFFQFHLVTEAEYEKIFNKK